MRISESGEQEPDYRPLLLRCGVPLSEGLAARICSLREQCLVMERNREQLQVLALRRGPQVRTMEVALKRVEACLLTVRNLGDAFAKTFGASDADQFAARFETSGVGQKRRALLQAFGDLIRELERERDSCIADTHPRYRKRSHKQMHRGLFKALDYEPARVGWQPEFRWFFGELVALIERECASETVVARVHMLQAVTNALFPDLRHSEESIKLARTRALRSKMSR